MTDGLYDINDVASLVVDRAFLQIDKSKYTEDAYKTILDKVDAAGSVAFIINDTDNYKENEFSYTTKVYGQGIYYSDFNELKYFSKMTIGDSNIIAPGPASELKILGTGNTSVTTLDNSIIINSNIDKEYAELEKKISYIDNTIKEIESAYTSFTYIKNNYQEKIKGGTYISIVDNIVSTYGITSSYDLSYLLDTNYYTKSEINLKEETLYDFVLQGYYNKPSIDTLLSNLKTNIVGNASYNFNTLEKISKWLEPSISYISLPYKDITSNSIVYEYDSYTSTYIIAKKPYSITGYYYQEYIKDSGYILSYINKLINDNTYIHTEIGIPHGYTYTLNGNKYWATGEISYKNGFTLDDEGHILSETYSTGIYKLINDLKVTMGDNLSYKVSYIDNKLSYYYINSLYNLNAYSYTSYITLSFDKNTPMDNPNRTLILNLNEAIYNKSYNTIKNGLTSAYTVSDMIDYRMEWIKINNK